MENSKSHYTNLESAVSSVFNPTEKYAFVGSTAYFYAVGRQLKLSEGQLCAVSSMKNFHAGRSKLGMLMRKGSPLRELFTQKYYCNCSKARM